jgi:hypothetical protein
VLNVHGFRDVRQIDIRTAEQLVPEPRPVEVGTAVRKLRINKSPGTDQIPTELVEAGCEKFFSERNKFITSVWNNDKLPRQWKECNIY